MKDKGVKVGYVNVYELDESAVEQMDIHTEKSLSAIRFVESKKIEL